MQRGKSRNQRLILWELQASSAGVLQVLDRTLGQHTCIT